MAIDTPRLNLTKPEDDDPILDFPSTVGPDFDNIDAEALLAKGDWDGGTAYVINDVVAQGGYAYRCILAHTNQQPPDAGYWESWGGSTAAAGGVLTGSYPNPGLGADVVENTHVAINAAIEQSKIDNLETDLSTLSADIDAANANIAAAELSVNKGAAGGYAALVSGKVPTAQLATGTADGTTFLRGDQTWATVVTTMPAEVGIAVSDETSIVTTGTAKVTLRLPFAMTLTAVRANVNTASSSGLPTVDINMGGTSILSTALTIDATEKTSVTAATPAVILTSALTDDAEITVDVDVAGTGTRGLKVWLLGTR